MSAKFGKFFEKGNPWEWKQIGEQPLDTTITLRLTKEQKDKIKKVPGWQGLLRDYIQELTSDVNGT
ncbi:MAG: hypothetical protein WBA39_25115 [Rivularia sp. (in: cyanobacteria)]